MKPLNLYFHIPFCSKKCAYCAFYSEAGKLEKIPDYVADLIDQARKLDCRASTIYFGGGTPSLLEPSQVGEILKSIKFDPGIEITLEANPESLNPDKLRGYLDVGINRLSIGLQAWQDDLLQKMGRAHNLEQFLNIYREARSLGFNNINVDLIFGLPGQTIKQWQETVQNIINLDPEHISCYSLELANDSVWGTLHKIGRLTSTADSIDRKMYYLAKKLLKKAGYLHYEISNFAKSGYQCNHNLDFWNGKPYLGIGKGAESNLDGATTREEWLMLNLRLTKGFLLDDYQKKFGTVFLDDFQMSEFMKINQTRVCLTSRGLDVANAVIERLINSDKRLSHLPR